MDLGCVAIVLMHFACAANAQPTNALSDAEIQGRALAQKILEQRPAENSTNTGVLSIRICEWRANETAREVRDTVSPARTGKIVYEVVRTNEFPAGERLTRAGKIYHLACDEQTNRYGHASENGDTAETQPISPHVLGVITHFWL